MQTVHFFLLRSNALEIVVLVHILVDTLLEKLSEQGLKAQLVTLATYDAVELMIHVEGADISRTVGNRHTDFFASIMCHYFG